MLSLCRAALFVQADRDDDGIIACMAVQIFYVLSRTVAACMYVLEGGRVTVLGSHSLFAVPLCASKRRK